MAFNFSVNASFGAAQASFGPSQPVSDDRHWFMRMLGGGRTKAGPSVSEHNALHLPVVYACFNRISNPVAHFPAGIFQKNSNGSSPVTEHPMSERIGLRPNDFMSSRTLRKVGQCHALGWGNGYIEIERNGKGQAVGLWPLLPWATHPLREAEGLFYRSTIAGQQFKIDYGDVLHVMDISQDGYLGLSPIGMARQALGMAMAMEEFGGKFFANDAKSGGFLMHPGRLSTAATANLKGRGAPGAGGDAGNAEPDNPASRFEAQGGLDNAHRVKVLEEGMKYISTTIAPEDAQFLGSREFQIAEIARIYDVPLILLQSHEKSTSWGTGIEQLMIGFIRQTIAPWVGSWEQELNWKLFTEQERKQGLYVKFNMNAWLRGDTAARAAFYKEMFSVAAMNPNKICALEDMDGIGPEGDEYFVPANFVTLKRALESPASPTTPTPGPPANNVPPTPLKRTAA
jgi:phage portal protein BeeE